MYWNSNDYEKIVKLIIDIYIDYNITSFPIDEKEICRKLGLKLIPYSVYSEEEQILFRKKSNDGFFVHGTKFTPNTIYYNDSILSHEKQRYTIFHEVKHFVNGDDSDEEYDDDMAEFFSRYFMAPIPYLIKMGINDVFTLISDHGMSMTAAENALKNVRSRKAKYGNYIFEHEKPLIELLCPDF